MNTRDYNKLTKDIFGVKFDPEKIKKNVNRTSSSPSRVKTPTTKKKSK
jgi:hypothetical protein